MQTLKLLSGSFITYALMAACGGSGGVSRPEATSAGGPAVSAPQAGLAGAMEPGGAGGESGQAPEGGAGQGGRAELGPADAGIVDALIDPVPDVYAAGAAGRLEGAAGQAGGTDEPSTGGSSGAPSCVVCECDCPEPEPYEPPEPEVVVAPCDVEVRNPNVSNVYAIYSVAEFPGRSVAELSMVRAVVPQLNAFTEQEPSGVTHRVVQPLLSDGRVWVNCGARTGNDVDKAESVTFILP